MLSEIEAYLTPFSWGSFNLLIMPPSFPYGGMENPLLTYAHPTGLRTETIVHEMVHQWFGNSVTCSTWGDIWLNEGLTVYLQRKLLKSPSLY
jgi:leukotriene-A4 hydrolase